MKVFLPASIPRKSSFPHRIRPLFARYPVLLFLLPVLFLAGCARDRAPVSKTGFYFDTVVTITLYDTNNAGPLSYDTILTDCFALCEAYEAMLSRTKEDSDIWKINHAGGAPVEVDPETAALLQKALAYCQASGGAADLTIAPLSSLWNFSSDNLGQAHTVPDTQQIRALLPHVDYRAVHIEGNTVTLQDPQAALDMGCIAKGYIADKLKQYLRSQGVESALINLGGNVLTLGEKPDGAPFRLGIRKPFAPENTPIAVLPVTDASLVSSGVYERFFEADGIRYHHLLDAQTGMPMQNGLLSVTILSESSADGDMLSTVCFLLGLTAGMEYVESLPDVEAVFITEDYALHPSSGLSGLLQTP